MNKLLKLGLLLEDLEKMSLSALESSTEKSWLALILMSTFFPISKTFLMEFFNKDKKYLHQHKFATDVNRAGTIYCLQVH